jgi:hypothetical protein
LPVLAFRIPDAAGLKDDETEQLSSFLAEVGSTTTYKALAPTDGLDLLSGEVQAALTAAHVRGDLGSRFSLFQKFDRFFSGQMGANTSLFSHEGPYIGRDVEIERAKAFLRSDDPLLLIKAPGGSGKSRLLLEFAKSAASAHDLPKVLFVDAAAQWTADDIDKLPSTPTVLVVDDAHRRIDLDRLIFACRQHNSHIRFVVSCRPSAVSIVEPHIASLSTTTPSAALELSPLTQADAETLARHHLGDPLAHLATRLVKIADRNPLVIAVGGRCIAEKRVQPEVLERTPEVFRSIVLDRLLDDPGLANAGAEARRKVLQIIAAVGPVITESDEFIRTLSSIVNSPQYEARQILASLERARFLVRRGRLVRVSPDVLADHLLYRAAVDDLGRPTGYVEEMLRAFSPDLLGNIVANAAELDWRASAAATHESVLATTWRKLIASLPSTTQSERAALVKQLKRSAVFAPEEVVKIAEWLANNREAPPDESLRAWGLDDSFERVADQVNEVFSFVATHRDFTRRCVQWLWDFAVSDTRPADRTSSHPRRRLAELLKYQWRADWREGNSVHAQIVDFFVSKLREQPRSDDRSWAVELLGGALDRVGEANESNARGFTFSQFPLSEFLPALSERRDKVIECFRVLTLGESAVEATAALRELSKLLHTPRGPLGGVKGDDIAVWQPEAELAIETIVEAGRSSTNEVVRFLARRMLREAFRQHWPQIAPMLDEAVEHVPAIPSEGLYDLLIGIPWEEQLDDVRAEENRVRQLCDEAAAAFWTQHKTAKHVFEQLLVGESAIQSVKHHRASHAGPLIRALILARPDKAEELVRAIADFGERGWSFLSPALVTTYDLQPIDAVRLADSFAKDQRESLRVAATSALRWMADGVSTSREVLEIARRLSQDDSRRVRMVVADILSRFKDTVPDEAIAVLLTIDWQDDVDVAAAVLNELDASFGLDPQRLTDQAIDSLLLRISALQSLEERNYDILDFIAFAASRRPESTVDMLLRRVRSVDTHQGEHGSDRWMPIPFDGHGLSLLTLANSTRYPDLLRRVRDAYLGASDMVRYWLPQLFHVTVVDPNIGFDVLREWLQSNDSEKIKGVANLLGGFDHTLVFTNDDFVAELLETAANAGAECLRQTKGELYALAIGGGYSSAPGQPAPRHVSDKASAQALISKYASRPTVKEFYEQLVEHAESSIQRQMLEWEEEGDE